MGLAQIIYLILAGGSVGIALIQHGKPKEGKENAWTTLFAEAIMFWILASGGFFS